MNKNIKAVIFDLDGTLLDTAPEFTDCLNQLLSKTGKSLVQEQHIRSIHSFNVQGMIELGFQLPPKHPEFNKHRESLLTLYGKYTGYKTFLFPGISNVISAIEDKNLIWAIVTNKPKIYTKALLDKFIFLQSAKTIICGDTLTTQKPHPEPLQQACRNINLDPKNCIYVGDAETDVQASHKAGMPCLVASYGYIPKNDNPLKWGADGFLAKPEDLLEYI